jgi:hypothetical protein
LEQTGNVGSRTNEGSGIPPYDLMNPKMRKWDKVSISMNLVVGITCYRSPEACKYKWQTLLLKYKRIADLHKET